MISVTEAKNIIRGNTTTLDPALVPLQHAAGLVLAEDVFSTMDIPAFRQSSMDGYAFSFDGWQTFTRLKITGMIQAGHKDPPRLSDENAVRIFTGAALPSGADTVVMQEKVRVDNGVLFIEDESLEPGAHVRPAGAEIKAGALALPKNTHLNPAGIGFLTGIGMAEAWVYPKPKVGIIVTGDELQEPGRPLQHGQVYEANSYTIKAALQELRIGQVTVWKAADKLEMLTDVLKQALEESDVVILTGGISVGDFDFVLQATVNNGVQKLFHRVKQRPAKPLYFGKKENKYVFGLPGNPASGLTSFYEYVLPALGRLCHNHWQDGLPVLQAPIAVSFKKPAGLTHFLKGFYDGRTATPLDAQESFRLSSFARANCLIQIGEELTECLAGQLVEVHLLPDL
jgi:molybdopterin molybdotransferase